MPTPEDYRIAEHECGHALYHLRLGHVPELLTREGGVRTDLPPGTPEQRYIGRCDVSGHYDNCMPEWFEYLMSGPAGEEVGEELHGYEHRENVAELVEAAVDYFAYEGERLGRVIDDSLETMVRFRDILLAIKDERKPILRDDPAFQPLVERLIARPTMTQGQIAAAWGEITGA